MFLPEIAARDALVALAALAGDPFAARECVDENREAGADLPVVYPVATSDDPIGSVGPDVDRRPPGLNGSIRRIAEGHSERVALGRPSRTLRGARVCKADTVEKR
jgi:hypothetical protein